MAERFIKFIPSEEALWLLKNQGNAFRLLTIIAESARREPGSPDGLNPGEAFIGDWESYGMSRQEYRTAVKILETREHLIVVETCRTRKKQLTKGQPDTNQKSTTGATTVGSKVCIISSNVWDINLEVVNHRNNHRTTTEQPPNNHKRRTKERKDVKETIDSDSFSADGAKKRKPSVSHPKTQTKLSEEKQKDFESIWKTIIKNKISINDMSHGIKETDLEQWLTKYEVKDICECLNMSGKAKPNRTWPGYVSQLLKGNIPKKMEDSKIGKEYVESFVKEHDLKHIEFTKDYFKDLISKEQALYSLPLETLKNILKRSLERFQESEIEEDAECFQN